MVTLATEGAAIALGTALLIATALSAPNEGLPGATAFLAPTEDGGLTMGVRGTF